MMNLSGPQQRRTVSNMQSPTSRLLFSYWMRLRGDRIAPLRAEIEPSRIGDILADTFILEQTSPDQYRYRLAGTRICVAMQGEVKGADWLEPWSNADKESLVTAFRTIIRDGTGTLLRANAINQNGQIARMETLILPLVNGEQGINRFLGTMSLLNKPYWLGSVPIERTEITDLRLIWPSEMQAVDGNQTGSTDVHSEPVLWRGHLAVYEGGRTE